MITIIKNGKAYVYDNDGTLLRVIKLYTPKESYLNKEITLGGGIEMVKFSEIKKSVNLDLPEKKVRIEKLIDETFKIKKVYILNSKFHNGEYAIVVFQQNKKSEAYFTTSSSVLIDQLKQIQKYLEENPNDYVEVTLRKPKRYFTFE